MGKAAPDGVTAAAGAAADAAVAVAAVSLVGEKGKSLTFEHLGHLFSSLPRHESDNKIAPPHFEAAVVLLCCCCRRGRRGRRGRRRRRRRRFCFPVFLSR